MINTAGVGYTSVKLYSGPDLRGGWAVAQGPSQLRGLHKKTVKNYYLRKHKNTFFKLKICSKN